MPEISTAKLERNRFHGAEFKRQIWVADIDLACTPQDILDPAFWSNVSTTISPFDRIEARCEDGTWMTELLVLEVGRAFVRVKPISHYELTTSDVAQSQDKSMDGFVAAWRGPHRKWSVKRLADNEWIHEGEANRDRAQDWINEHLKAQV